MNKEKIKTFVKEHRNMIIKGTVVFACGCVAGGFIAGRMNSAERHVIDILSSFASKKKEQKRIMQEMSLISNGSTHLDMHMFGDGGMPIGELGYNLMKYYESTGIDMNTRVTGLALFDNR